MSDETLDARGHATTVEVGDHLHTVPADDPDDGKVPCPECGKRYVPGPGLGVHRASQHGTINKTTGKGNPRKECPECHKWFSSKDMARHLRRHGINARNDRLQQLMPPEEEEALLDVDDILTVVVDMLFPGGVVPTKAVMSLIRWRAETQRMINEVTGAS